MSATARAARRLVTAGTRLARVPLVPEISLYQADEPFTVWEWTQRAAATDDLPPPFWAFAWAGGQALARYILDNPGLVRGRAVLDVAAGSGLLAIAAARCGAGPVTAVDVDERAVAAIAANAAANAVTVTAVRSDILDRDPPQTGVLVCGDAFYEREMARRMFAFLRRARATGQCVLVGDPGRTFLPSSELTPVATYQVPVTVALEGITVKRSTVYELTAAE